VILASFATLGLFTTPGWHEEEDENGSIREVKPFPKRGVMVLSFATMLISGLLQLVGSLWQHVAATAAKSLIGSFESQGVSSHIGQASMAFTWVACFFLLICAFMLRVTMDSVLVLSTVFSESDDDIYITLRSREESGLMGDGVED
jgi:hypothetical protein